jgi:hypothetical protein
MAQRAGRITCPRCGANNFDTVTVCWKCQLPLNQGAVPTATSAMPPAPMSPMAPFTQERVMPPAPAYSPPPSMGDSGVARRAAIVFALTLPFISLPVGWTFMMIEDHRRQAIGRICVYWSLAALFFHLLLGFVAAQAIGPYLNTAITMAAKAAAPSQGRDMSGGNGLP